MEPLAESPSVMKMQDSVSLVFAFTVTQVVAAVAQFAVVQVGFLGAFACQLGDAGNGFALFLGVLYLCSITSATSSGFLWR